MKPADGSTAGAAGAVTATYCYTGAAASAWPFGWETGQALGSSFDSTCQACLSSRRGLGSISCSRTNCLRTGCLRTSCLRTSCLLVDYTGIARRPAGYWGLVQQPLCVDLWSGLWLDCCLWACHRSLDHWSFCLQTMRGLLSSGHRRATAMTASWAYLPWIPSVESWLALCFGGHSRESFAWC